MKRNNVLIYGSGAVGIALGTSLSSQGMNVSFLARGETLKIIKNCGTKRTGLFGTLEVGPGQMDVVASMSELTDGSIDFVMVTVKTLVSEEAARTIFDYRKKLSENAKIVIFQNGWGNEQPFTEYFPEEMVYRARVITGFVRTEPNVSNITVYTAPILLGSLCGADTECLEPVARAIAASGIPCETTDELSPALWAKMIYNTTLNALGAILKVPYGRLAESTACCQIMDRLIDETFMVMDLCGYHTFWETPEDYRGEFYGKLIPDTYTHRSSTLQDMEKKQKTEMDTLNGCIVRLAEEHGREAPTHRMLCELITALEENYIV